MFVNSAHHQAVKDLGKGLQINAIADDGVIEGIEYQDLDFCIGIQWHPEFLIDSKDIEIFRSLVNFSKKNSPEGQTFSRILYFLKKHKKDIEIIF